jgi:hypothetical protein
MQKQCAKKTCWEKSFETFCGYGKEVLDFEQELTDT